MYQLRNYTTGQWTPGDGDGHPQYHALTGELLGTASSEGLDYAAILAYSRKTGGSVLRRMSFPERGRMLKALAAYLLERKEKYYTVSGAAFWRGGPRQRRHAAHCRHWRVGPGRG